MLHLFIGVFLLAPLYSVWCHWSLFSYILTKIIKMYTDKWHKVLSFHFTETTQRHCLRYITTTCQLSVHTVYFTLENARERWMKALLCSDPQLEKTFIHPILFSSNSWILSTDWTQITPDLKVVPEKICCILSNDHLKIYQTLFVWLNAKIIQK